MTPTGKLMLLCIHDCLFYCLLRFLIKLDTRGNWPEVARSGIRSVSNASRSHRGHSWVCGPLWCSIRNSRWWTKVSNWLWLLVIPVFPVYVFFPIILYCDFLAFTGAQSIALCKFWWGRQGYALAAPGGAWCQTFTPGQQGNLQFFIEIICKA